MDIFRFAERLMLMDDETWQRHAHPISVWSRVFLSLPLLILRSGHGAALVYLGKMWFVDRMAWLYEDMKNAHPEYAAWMR